MHISLPAKMVNVVHRIDKPKAAPTTKVRWPAGHPNRPDNLPFATSRLESSCCSHMKPRSTSKSVFEIKRLQKKEQTQFAPECWNWLMSPLRHTPMLPSRVSHFLGKIKQNTQTVSRIFQAVINCHWHNFLVRGPPIPLLQTMTTNSLTPSWQIELYQSAAGKRCCGQWQMGAANERSSGLIPAVWSLLGALRNVQLEQMASKWLEMVGIYEHLRLYIHCVYIANKLRHVQTCSCKYCFFEMFAAMNLTG